MALVSTDFVSSWQAQQHVFGLLAKFNLKQKKQAKAIKTHKQKIFELESALGEAKEKCKKRKMKVDELEKKVCRAEEFVQSMMQGRAIQLNSEQRGDKRFRNGEPILPPAFMSYNHQGFPQSPFTYTNSLTTQELDSSDSDENSSTVSSLNSKRMKYDPTLLVGYSAWETSMLSTSKKKFSSHHDEPRRTEFQNIQLARGRERRDPVNMSRMDSPSERAVAEPKGELDSTFCCRTCSESFDTKKDLKMHRKLNPVYACDSCADEFHTRKLMRRHIRNHHESDGNKEIGEEPYPQASSAEELNSAKENEFECAVCFVKLKTKKELKRHTKKLHQIESNDDESDKVITEITDISGPAETTKVALPPVTSIKISAVQPEIDLVDEKVDTSTSTNPAIERAAKRKRRCPICAVYVDDLRPHLDKKHAGIVYHSCTVCPSAFKLLKNLNEHMRRSHPPEQETEDKGNETTQTVKRHKKLVIHKKNKTTDMKNELPNATPGSSTAMPEKLTALAAPTRQSPRKVGSVDLDRLVENSNALPGGISTTLFVCNFCDRKFDNWIIFKDHALSHEAAKPTERRTIPAERGIKPSKKYICQICSKVSGSYDFFVEHFIDVHALQKDYQCHRCLKSFSAKPLLERHSTKCKN